MTTHFCWLFCTFAALFPLVLGAETAFSVASFNLENFYTHPSPNRPLKPQKSRLKVQESILTLQPDVLAVQEIGDAQSFSDLQSSLKSNGLHLPHAELVRGSDTNICLGILSRFPIMARRPHTNLHFFIDGHRFRMARGVAEVEIAVNPTYRFTLLNAHLKSKRPIAEADEAEVREQEARQLRRIIDRILTRKPGANVVVCGDFNDTPDSLTLRSLLGTGAGRLIDTRPEEMSGLDFLNRRPKASGSRATTWTHFYSKSDLYSRFDYILLSPGMAAEWSHGDALVLNSLDWGLASDHRPIMARFTAP